MSLIARIPVRSWSAQSFTGPSLPGKLSYNQQVTFLGRTELPEGVWINQKFASLHGGSQTAAVSRS